MHKLGYDVWLGNNRGNKHSREHISINPNTKEFWDFSLHEMGLYDVPSIVDYIKASAKVDRITYVGHSQGCAQFFALCSLQPQFCKESFTGMIALGPAVFVTNIKSGIVYSLARLHLDQGLDKLGFNEIFTTGELDKFGKYLCYYFRILCNGVLDLISDADPLDNNQDRMLVYYSHFPSGASVKSFVHYAENIRRKTFAELKTENEYPLQNVDVDVSIFVGQNDLMANTEDVRNLKSILGDKVSYYKEYEHMGHMTFFMTKGQEGYIEDVVKQVVRVTGD